MSVLHFSGAVGMVLVLVVGKIAAPVRSIYPPLLGCAMCSGFWVGLFVGFFVEFRGQEMFPRCLSAVFYGFAVSVVSYTLYAVLHRMGLP